jgi:outer membrane lipoprotein-sorting protein
MKTGVFLSVFLCFFMFSFGQSDGMKPIADVESVKKRLEKSAAETMDISAAFLQEKHLNVLEEMITSRGVFYFKKENKVRWNYDSPFDYLIVINGQKMYVNDEGREKQYDLKSSRMFREINKIVLGTVQGNLFTSPDYTSTFFENRDYILIKMVPVDVKMRGFIREIGLYLDKGDFTVAKLRMEESEGDFTLIHFSSKKVNSGLKDDLFYIR